MSKGMYVGVGDKAHSGKAMYVGVNGVARKVTKGYIGVNGVAKLFYEQRPTVGSLDVGSSIWLNMNGTKTEFIVVHQGLPSNIYDASCDGTWILMKNVYNLYYQWSSTGTNDYTKATHTTFLNDTIYAKWLDDDVRAAVKVAKIPYTAYNTTKTQNVMSGANGSSQKVFLLSCAEVGITDQYSDFPKDGAVLSYFSKMTGNNAAPGRVATRNTGAVVWWWLRSRNHSYTDEAYTIGEDGRAYMTDVTSNGTHYLRPAMILQKSFPVPDAA